MNFGQQPFGAILAKGVSPTESPRAEELGFLPVRCHCTIEVSAAPRRVLARESSWEHSLMTERAAQALKNTNLPQPEV